jgi:acyl carrier protein
MIQNTELLDFFEEQYRSARGSRRSIRLSDRMYDGLGIDSLLASELLVALEDRYDVHLLHDPRVWKVAEVGELLNLVRVIDLEQRARAAVQSADAA